MLTALLAHPANGFFLLNNIMGFISSHKHWETCKTVLLKCYHVYLTLFKTTGDGYLELS